MPCSMHDQREEEILRRQVRKYNIPDPHRAQSRPKVLNPTVECEMRMRNVPMEFHANSSRTSERKLTLLAHPSFAMLRRDREFRLVAQCFYRRLRLGTLFAPHQ